MSMEKGVVCYEFKLADVVYILLHVFTYAKEGACM